MDLDVGVLGRRQEQSEGLGTPRSYRAASLARVQSNTQLVHARDPSTRRGPLNVASGNEVDPRLNVASSNEACPPLNVARFIEVFVLVA
jgi:hypothetical protein